MSGKLLEEWSKLIHRMGREREDRIIGGETKLKVAIQQEHKSTAELLQQHRANVTANVYKGDA